MKSILFKLFLSFLFFSAIAYAQTQSEVKSYGSGSAGERIYARAIITDIQRSSIDAGQSIIFEETRIFLKILDGKLKGEVKQAVFRGENNIPIEMTYHKGNIVFIGISSYSSEGSVESVSIYDKDNTKGIIFICILLVVAVIIVGRLRGFAALLSLIVTIFLLFVILILMTLKGYS
ncbi:MAG: hypothetical protein FWG92_07930, partial [Leptospirales bacterium]|nr:hypothetical protein [Leptospirales bacterium]